MLRWLLVLVALASLMASAQERRAVNFYSAEKEADLGVRLASGVRKNIAVVESAAVSRYVEPVGLKPAVVLPDRDLGGSTNEPLALPGGAIFIPANLVFAARSEAEFAGMMAHAIAHVAARHGTRLATRAQTDNLGFSAVMYSNLGWREDGDKILRDLQRSFEVEAEYAPDVFADYIGREQKDIEGDCSAILTREEEVAAIRGAILGLPRNEHLRMQEELDRLKPVAQEGGEYW